MQLQTRHQTDHLKTISAVTANDNSSFTFSSVLTWPKMANDFDS